MLSSVKFRHLKASELIVTDHPYVFTNNSYKDSLNIPEWVVKWLKEKFLLNSKPMKKSYPNAITEDYNKNGIIDTWYVDDNKNGEIDTAYLDDNEDGIIETILFDDNENKVWETQVMDEDQDGKPEKALIDRDENGKPDTVAYDTNQDGKWDKFEK